MRLDWKELVYSYSDTALDHVLHFNTQKMIAVIRVKFNDTPQENVWSDEAMNNWLNPGIEFSLAHFWARTSFFQADMRYYLFPPISMDDPRTNTPPDGDTRLYLVNGVTDQITQMFNPDWRVFDSMLICFAQLTDLFGGGSYPVSVEGGKKYLSVAVCDIGSPFSDICQEVGHAFGLEHEMDDSGNEYMSPYSSMSSESYGGATTSFERPENPDFPTGIAPAPNITHINTNDVQRIIGPYITPAQLYWVNMGIFKFSNSIYHLPVSFHTTPHTFQLNALDNAIDTWPQQKIALAVLPPENEGGETYFLELRRNVGYDRGLSIDGSNRAPVAVVIHAQNASNGRIRYVDKIALQASPGDRDYHCFRGHFTVRLISLEEDFSRCSLTVGGGDFWKYFGVDIEKLIPQTIYQYSGEWTNASISPCFMFPVSNYLYRNLYSSTEIIAVASSFGYEKPNYRWLINDIPLDISKTFIKVPLAVKVPQNGNLDTLSNEEILINYQLNQNMLKLSLNQHFAGIYISLSVIVNESSTEVLQNMYPDRSIWTGISINNVSIEWDQAFNQAQKACSKRIHDVNDHYSISESPVPQRGPQPGWEVDTGELLNEMVRTNPALANIMINEVARIGNISKLDVIKRLR